MIRPWTTIRELKSQVATLQHTVDDVLSGTLIGARTEGNPYPSYKEQVDELSRKYTNTARWGNASARNLIDVRAAFIISEGVRAASAVADNDAKREMDWLSLFMQHNGLDNEVPQDWAKEAEIEGKILLRLSPNSKTKQIDVRFVSWTQHGYVIKAAEGDYARYESAKYKLDRSGREITLAPEEFVYLRFGGRTHHVNETPPKLGSVLANMEALNKALVDWRKINKYYASPTPYFEVTDKSAGDALYAKLQQIKWRIGQFLVGNAKFSLVGMPEAGVNSTKEEIVTHAQILSGTSGVPVHFLGFPELMSNRSTADNLFENVHASVLKERRVWVGGYEELFEKAILMANKNFQAGLNADNVTAEIPEASSQKLAELKDVWFPLRESREISRESFLARIPDIDVAKEVKRLEKEDARAVENAVNNMRNNGQPPEDDDE